MKTILLAAVAVVCFAFYLPYKTIKGNGKVSKELRNVSAFSGVKLAGSMNIVLSYGEPGSITVEADENLIPYIETTVEDGVLKVKSKDQTNLKSDNKITVYVTADQLSSVAILGSGSVKGKGNFHSSQQSSFVVMGSGDIDLGVQSLNEAKVNIQGSGNIYLSGKASTLQAIISGSGNIDCNGLVVSKTDATISGSGNIKVNASESIDAKISGSGNVYHTGKATKVSVRSSGSGKAIRQ